MSEKFIRAEELAEIMEISVPYGKTVLTQKLYCLMILSLGLQTTRIA